MDRFPPRPQRRRPQGQSRGGYEMSDLSPGATASVLTPIPLRLCACGCGGILAGRKKRFASRLCNSRFYDREHPRINRGPRGPREGTLKALILAYLADGAWRTEQQIADSIH